LPLAGPAQAATATGCEAGGFVIKLQDGREVGTDGATTIPATNLGSTFLVDGRYVEFTVVVASFGITNWTFTGATNLEDLTDGRPTVVFTAKTPNHRGLTLISDVLVDRSGEDIVIERHGPGLSMKIQAKDCATGGVFQMEVERDDGTATRFTHSLADDVFYYDNPNFRAREGEVVPFTNSAGATQMITIAPRINTGKDGLARFVGRDSPQVATRVPPPPNRLGVPQCVNQIPKRDGTLATVRHCGGESQWDVQSGGRMGWVTGEDATEVAPPATNCVMNCQAQNQVRGGAVVLGNPFPVPAESRLQPRVPSP
jgi:hypothetical protein